MEDFDYCKFMKYHELELKKALTEHGYTFDDFTWEEDIEIPEPSKPLTLRENIQKEWPW